MASSIPAACDYLVTRIRGLAVSQPPVVVADGWPVTSSDTVVTVGIDSEDGDSDTAASYAELSGQEYEEVELPCLVAARRSGSDAAKPARDAAYELFDAVRQLVADDRRLGGAIRTGLPARVSRWTMSQTVDARQAGEGRVCEIRFVVAWQHRG